MKDEKTGRELAEISEVAAEALGLMLRDGGRGPGKGPDGGPGPDPRGPAWWRDRVWGRDESAQGSESRAQGKDQGEDPRPGDGGRKDATTDPDAGKAEDEPRWKRELRARLAWAREQIARERAAGKSPGAEASGPRGDRHLEDRGARE